MPTLSATARCALLAGLSLAILSTPARAQVFGATPASDRQDLNLAGGDTYVEGLWLPFTRIRFNATDDGTFQSAGSPIGLEEEGRARPSFGVEGRFVLPTAPLLFGTAEYRYEQIDKARLYVGQQSTDRVDIDRQNLNIFKVGGGVRAPGTPFYARAEYNYIRLDGGNAGDFGISGHKDGYALHGGVAQPVTSWLGVRGEAGYQDLGDYGRGFIWQVGANLNLSRVVALTGSYRSAQLRDGSGTDRTGTRLQEVTVGLRFQFNRS